MLPTHSALLQTSAHTLTIPQEAFLPIQVFEEASSFALKVFIQVTVLQACAQAPYWWLKNKYVAMPGKTDHYVTISDFKILVPR